MIHTFTFNGIGVTVNDQKDSPYIEFDDLDNPAFKKRFTLIVPKPDFGLQSIIIEFQEALISNGTPITGKTVQRFGRQSYFDFFYNLKTALSLGEVIGRSSLNNQLESMSTYFGEPIQAFDPANDWSPINFPEFSVTSTNETFLGNDGTITITSISPGILEYRVTGNAGVIQTWSSNPLLTALVPDTYTVEVRNSIENNFEGNPKTVVINAFS